MNTRINALLASTLLALASCTTPVVDVGRTAAQAVVVPVSESRLVFGSPTVAASRDALGDATYLTVQLKSVADGTLRFGTADKQANGSYAVSFSGLAAEDWVVKARFFTNATTPELKAFGNTTAYIKPGSSSSIALTVYLPGSVSSVALAYAQPVASVEISSATEFWGSSTTVVPVTRTLLAGDEVQLFAATYSATPNVEATDQSVVWSTDDASVVELSANGNLKGLVAGTATISATSVEGRIVASIDITVDEPAQVPVEADPQV